MCSYWTGMKAKYVLTRTCPELSAFSRLAWEAEKKCIPYTARVVNIKLCIQTGTALTEETEKLSDNLMMRSCICNMQTKSLVCTKTMKDVCPPQSRLCPFPCESGDGTLLRWPEIHSESKEHFPDAKVVKPRAPLCPFILASGIFFQLILVELHSVSLGSWHQPVGIIQMYESFLLGCLRTIDWHERGDSEQTTAEIHIFTWHSNSWLECSSPLSPTSPDRQRCWLK